MKGTFTLLHDRTRKYLRQARFLAKEWSKDPSTQCGTIAIGKKGQVLSTGFNGFPRGIKDTPTRLNNREEKYKYVVHSEQNCIYNAALTGVSLDNSEMYIWGLPVCSECAKAVIQVGVQRVFTCHPAEISEKWRKSGEFTSELFSEAGVRYMTYYESEID